MRVSEGDLRKAITFLQSAARLHVDKEITERAVVEIAGVRCTTLCHETFKAQTSSYCITTMSLCCAVLQIVPAKMTDNLLHICFRGTFEKLEVAVRVGVYFLILKNFVLYGWMIWLKDHIMISTDMI